MKKYLFIDMDGVIVKWLRENDGTDLFLKAGYFENLPPAKKMLRIVKDILNSGEYDGAFILSKLFNKIPNLIDQKNKWINKYAPEIELEHRLYVPEDISKIDYIKQKFPNWKDSLFILIDDYTPNLIDWEVEENFKAIKVYNTINGRNGRWEGKPSIDVRDDENDIITYLNSIN